MQSFQLGERKSSSVLHLRTSTRQPLHTASAPTTTEEGLQSCSTFMFYYSSICCHTSAFKGRNVLLYLNQGEPVKLCDQLMTQTLH